MKSRYEEFVKSDDYFEPHDKSFESYVATHIMSQQRFLITKYNLSKISSPPEDLKARLLFLIANYRMFRCEAVFFKMDLPTLDLFRKLEFSQLVKYFPEFYVVEPLPMITLADYATSYPINGKILLRMLPSLLNTLALCHSNNFTYLNLSPFSIIVFGNVFWLRPPSLQPYSAPKCVFAPPPQSFRSSFRSVNEMRFYRAPEWDSLPRFVQSDSWSLGAILGEYLVFGGPMFGAINFEDQMERTQMILGEAPPSLNWAPPTITATADLPDIIKELLDYDPRNRPVICIHLTHAILDYIRETGVFGDDDVSRVSTMQDTESAILEEEDGENSPPSYQSQNQKSSSHRSTPSITSSGRCSCSSKHTSNSKQSSYAPKSSSRYSASSKRYDQRNRSSSMATPSSNYSRSNAAPSSARSGSSVSSRRSTSNTPSVSASVLSTPGTSASSKSRQSSKGPSYTSSHVSTTPSGTPSSYSVRSNEQSSAAGSKSSNAPSRSYNAPSRSSNNQSRNSKSSSQSLNTPSPAMNSKSQSSSASRSSSRPTASTSNRASSESPVQDNISSGNASSTMSSKNSYSSRRRTIESSPQSSASSSSRRNRSPDAVSTNSTRSNTSSRSYKSNRSSNRGSQADVKWINDNRSSSSSHPRRETSELSYGTGTGLSASNGKRGEYKEIAPSPMPFHVDTPSASSRSSSSKRRLFEEEENQPSFHTDSSSAHSNAEIPVPDFVPENDYEQDDELISDPEMEEDKNQTHKIEETEQKIEDIEKTVLSDHLTDNELEEEDFDLESDHESVPSVKSYHTEPQNDEVNDTVSSAYSSPISSSKRSAVSSSPESAADSVYSKRSYVSEEELEPQMSPPRVTFTEDYSTNSPTKSGSDVYSNNPSGTYSYSTSSSAMELESIQRRIKTLEETFSQSRVDTTTINDDQNSPETSSSDGSEVRRQILNIGSRLEEFDGDLLVDCGGCSTNSIVNDSLRGQEVTLERTIEDMQNDSDN